MFHVKHCAWSIVSPLSAAGGQSATREDLRGSEPSVPGSPDVRYIGEQARDAHQNTWMFHVKHCAWSIVSPLSAAGGQSAMREDLRGSELSVSGSPDVRYIGESRSGNSHQDT
jgi:putative hemolysin